MDKGLGTKHVEKVTPKGFVMGVWNKLSSKGVKKLTLKECILIAWNKFSTKQKVFAVIAFMISLGFNVYGIAPTVMAGDYTLITVTSIIMAVFGFIGTWTMAVQWHHTFKANGVQNVAGILVGGLSGVYGDMFTSLYYLITEFVGHLSWNKKRNADGELVVDKKFGTKDITIAIVFWTIGLGALSFFMGGQKIILDALTNGLSFTAQQRQVKGHLDGLYLWLLVDVLSFVLFLSLGNPIVAFSYAGMFTQGLVGLMIWKQGK